MKRELLLLLSSIVIGLVDGQTLMQYLIFEGGGPDEGPGPDPTIDLLSIKSTFGEIPLPSQRMYAFGFQQVRILTRSIAFLRAEMETMFNLTEQAHIPLFVHIDPLYAWGADEENSTMDAPALKYWNDEQMREWIEFPLNQDQLPQRIPRPWFNWGQWCSPTSAVPAIGSPKFLDFASQQLAKGVLAPIAEWITRLAQKNQSFLFAGINIGWETNIFNYRQIDPGHLPVAVFPLRARNISMQPWEAGAQLGYASLYWQGWNETTLKGEAQRRNITRDALFKSLCYSIIQQYLQRFAQVCADYGIPRDHVFTHIVPMASVDSERTDTTVPPIWTAVNNDSTPGFTMDNRGAAIYNLTEIRRQIALADPSQTHFAVSESYLFNYGDETSMRENLNEAFNNGALIKAIYGALPFAQVDPQPIGAINAIRQWLQNEVTFFS